MQTSPRTTNRRQSWLNAYRIATPILLLVLIALSVVGLVRSGKTIVNPVIVTATQADKVTQAASFLESVGFNDPLYKGITPATEGQYPTFQVTAIGGKSLNVWIRTTPNGGWEIQPSGMTDTVASADDFARKAQQAVLDWQNMPSDVKPRTDGTFGEYEDRKYMYDLLSKYNPDPSYWSNSRSETSGWPAK